LNTDAGFCGGEGVGAALWLSTYRNLKLSTSSVAWTHLFDEILFKLEASFEPIEAYLVNSSQKTYAR
jgi:hypothetical protein